MARLLVAATLAAVLAPTIDLASARPDPRAAASEGCRTPECDRRVIKKRAVHATHPFCNTWRCVRRVDAKRARRAATAMRRVVQRFAGWLASTRACESGGSYTINTGNGFFGAYQFTRSSWAAVGGRGLPHQASPLEQDFRAVLLLRLQGRGAWPVCG
jgi:hypothetical protein